jgi:hypothetical protein
VAAAVWKTCQADPHWGGLAELFACLVELDEPGLHEWLVRQAYEPDGVVRTSGRRAWIIRALARIDIDAAFRACESALLSEAHDLSDLARTLIDLDPERAIPVLCKVAAQAAKAAVRYAVGLALRHVRQRVLVRAELENLLQSQSATERKVAVELAGWAGPGSLDASTLRAALDDHSLAVRVAAGNALGRYEIEADANELLALLKESRGAQAWSLLDAVLRSSNPHALQTKGDPLCVGDAYPDDDVPYWLHCRSRLERRVKEIEKELDDMDRKDE